MQLECQCLIGEHEQCYVCIYESRDVCFFHVISNYFNKEKLFVQVELIMGLYRGYIELQKRSLVFFVIDPIKEKDKLYYFAYADDIDTVTQEDWKKAAVFFKRDFSLKKCYVMLINSDDSANILKDVNNEEFLWHFHDYFGRQSLFNNSAIVFGKDSSENL